MRLDLLATTATRITIGITTPACAQKAEEVPKFVNEALAGTNAFSFDTYPVES